MKTIDEMAEEAGAVSYSPPPMRAVRGVSFTYEQLDAFADLVRADEREACAELADHCADNIGPVEYDIGAQLAAAIRSRGQA